jgi:hypothetical protein
MRHYEPKVIGFGRSEPFVLGSGGKIVTVEEALANKEIPVAFFGVGYTVLHNIIINNNLDYYFLDTGYIGNIKTKIYKRITKNNLNNTQDILDRPNDRLEKLTLDRTKFKRGDRILVIPPDQKVLNCFGRDLDANAWIDHTVNLIRKHTDREIIVRERIRNRTERMFYYKFTDALQDNIHACVVWSSNCAVESVLHQIPVVSLGPTATTKVSPFSINQIDSVPTLDEDLIDKWLRHLSYCQFTDEDMRSGFAWSYVNQ